MRLDLPAPQPSAASAAEVTRQQLAIGLSELAQAPASSPLAPLAARAHAQADLLGGVWQACPPTAAPSDCTHLPASPEIVAPTSTAAEKQMALQLATDLVQALSDDGALARSGAGIVPVFLAQLRTLEADPKGAARQLLTTKVDGAWTSDTGVLQALDWGAWQMEAFAARESAAGREPSAARTMAAQWRAAVNAAAASQPTWPGGVHRTDNLSEVEVLEQTARRIAARLAEVPSGELPAVTALLTDISERLLALGFELPASWLAG